MRKHKFNVGETIRHKLNKEDIRTVLMIDSSPYFMYRCTNGTCLDVCACDNQYERVKSAQLNRQEEFEIELENFLERFADVGYEQMSESLEYYSNIYRRKING